MSSTELNSDLTKYKKLNKIGQGSFGEVYRIQDKETGQIYAAKISLTEVNSNSQEDMLNISREVNINASIDHPAVLKFISYSSNDFDNKPKPVIITEYAVNGCLSQIIELESHSLSPHLWNDTKKLINIYGIASGMSFLHEKKIIHRDLKPDNILVDEMLFPKISDFGLSKRLHSNKSMTLISQSGLKGTPIYLSPESLQKNEQTEASDVYAFSLIMYQILTTKIPYKDLSYEQLFQKVVNGETPSFDTIIEKPYKDLIERCWSKDPKERPTFSQIVEELEKNQDFLTETIEQEDFYDYVEFIKEYKKSFKEKKIIKIEDFIKNKASETFKKIDIRRYIEEQHQQQNKSFFGRFFKKEILYPADDLLELNEECQYFVTQAENDPEKQFYIGTYLIEGKNGFPKKIDRGVKYLERSISGKFIESVIYLSKMLIDGDLIAKDLKKAKKYLLDYLKSKNLRIFALYARILFKENNYKKSREYFEICAKENDTYSMYKYAQMLIFGLGGNKNIDDAMFYFTSSKNKGFHKSEFYIKALLIYENNESFWNLPSETQYFLIKQIIKYNKDNDDSNISFTLKKIYMKLNDTQTLFSNKSFVSDDFKVLLNQFDEIKAEIAFPSKQFQSILQTICQLNPKVTICVIVMGVNSISNKFGPDNKINQVIIDDSVKKIKSLSFENCWSLTEIIIPPSVELIGDNAFSGCTSLKQITIPSSVKSIGNNAFSGCTSLKQITIPSSVTKIGNFVFNRCSSLIEIIIPPSVELIGDNAFSGCTSLKQITIPSSVKSIGNYAFYNCELLKEITIPSSVISIGQYSFYNCHSITRVMFLSPSNIKSIQASSFENCSSLLTIKIPYSVESIDHFAFKNCTKLREVTFLRSIEALESDAFFGCSSLQNFSDYPTINVLILGGSSVGKTSIMHRFTENKFTEYSLATIGVDFKTKLINICGNKVKLLLYDSPGAERYRNITKSYFKLADCAIVVIDLNDSSVFDYTIMLFKDLLKEFGHIPVAFLGNKCDIKERSQYVTEELAKLKKEYDFKYFEVSARDNINIEEAFYYVANEVYK